ncbi:MAG: mechanosensitive ion channel family protein [Clostridia bacterium]|nr:mechanosensitive ion channel family protein [Clostridia bacterium]
MDFNAVYETAGRILSNQLVRSALVIVFALVFYSVVSAVLKARGRKLKELDRKKSETYLHIINSAIKYAVFILAFFMLLSVNRVDITSMIAGLGIAGIILGVAVQDALKDIIRGFDILSDDYFKVGDLIDYNGTEGVVVEIGIKTTKIKALKTDNIISIPNRDIVAVAKVSKFIFIEIPMPYETSLEDAEAALSEICAESEKAKDVNACSYIGVNKLDESAIQYLIKIECKDNLKKLQIRRDALRRILEIMAKHGITVPYNQLDVHTK